jgi:metal-responsive CopG/Arc/MetJ family transcriptional regulator
MNDTFISPTRAELDEFLRRGHVARSEAIAAMVWWIRAKLTRRQNVPAGANYA